ncbi:hypothetical protein [Microvirga sp. VF16]|uniref:hypothetical protein n=1 Tax=Microvirga sp. VF16 TaxID=2807101 RepID=UPI00193D84C6|nr:hypothetical protein [Microvirga sp. VF16]QRM27623.1 hypothetical protein JO965_15175 [Microvirga sp. VF16]
MSNPVSESLASDPAMPSPRMVIATLGITQILAGRRQHWMVARLGRAAPGGLFLNQLSEP